MTVIRGEKVILREKSVTDAARDYAWRTDEELSRLDAANPLQMAFPEFLMFYVEELEYPTPRRRRFAIDTLDGKHIGNCMYYDINEIRGECELGIMVGDRNYWSNGYGTDAVKALLDHIFTTTRMKRVYLHTLDWNIRAQKSFEKAGFVPHGRITRGGKTFIQMDILREQWEQRRLAAQRQAEKAASGNGARDVLKPVGAKGQK
ncbi:MAG: GNAT family N-acetyltransferase [Chloroflexi bacterium]|nr:GNAT family N-acetyltransferase [Chloroflexota bacterium]